ncbi:hypothetical protein M8C21_026964, partial [Ambrosia artemisiifolia]
STVRVLCDASYIRHLCSKDEEPSAVAGLHGNIDDIFEAQFVLCFTTRCVLEGIPTELQTVRGKKNWTTVHSFGCRFTHGCCTPAVSKEKDASVCVESVLKDSVVEPNLFASMKLYRCKKIWR